MKTVTIYWTGGFDSTYRIMYLLFISKVDVQPIYIRDNIDHYSRKRNIQYELDTLEILYEYIQHKLINMENSLFSIIYTKKPILSNSVISLTNEYYLKNYIRRPITQFAYCLEYAIQNGIVIENCTLLTDKLGEYIIDIINDPLVQHLHFPLQFLGKCEIWALSLKRGWLDILNRTMSCWYHVLPTEECIKCKQYKNIKELYSKKKLYLVELKNKFK